MQDLHTGFKHAIEDEKRNPHFTLGCKSDIIWYLCGNKSCVILTVGGVDTQVDGYGGDALVGPGDAVRLRLNLLPHLIEIRELFPLTVQKLCVLYKEMVK